MRGIEFFVILAVTALHLAVVARGARLDQFMLNTELPAGLFKESKLRCSAAVESIRELHTVIGLDTFDQVRKLFKAMFEKNCRGIGDDLVKCF